MFCRERLDEVCYSRHSKWIGSGPDTQIYITFVFDDKFGAGLSLKWAHCIDVFHALDMNAVPKEVVPKAVTNEST